ncbi:MAG: hypothetical protein A2Z02_05910 [Chloroflexi bacterium RBG_16_48_7]|nr:MAG: hypothetical protein A2Z02_05910 [Chloroflexi bacterium RBG_16_48_7]
MKVVTGIFTTIGILAVLLLIFLLVGYLLFSLTPDMKSQIVTSQPSAEAAKSFNTKVTTFRSTILESALAKQKVDVSLTLTELEINSKIIDMQSEGKLPVKDMILSLGDNLIITYFVLDYEGINARIGMTAKPEMVKNDLKMNVIKFELGKLPLPKSVYARAGDVFNILIKMQNPLNELPADLKAVEFINKQVTIRVTTKPGN